jgi:uncharacterized membrane protein YgcG
MKTTKVLAALGAVLLLSACEHSGSAFNMHRFESPDFGDSVRSNVAAESVPADPEAVNSPVEADGARQSLAQARYHTDHVKVPPSPATSTITTGSGSSTEGSSGSGGGTGTTGGGGY